MQRYFVHQPFDIQDIIQLGKEDSHHLLRVLRCDLGKQVEVVNQHNELFLAELSNRHDSIATLTIIKKIDTQTEFGIPVAIACGLSKQDKLEWIIQKATECGMTHFIPVSLQRDVMRWKKEKSDKKYVRFKKIMKEAAEQCHRTQIPKLLEVSTLDEMIQYAEQYTVKLIAYEEQSKQNQHHTMKEIFQTIQSDDSIVVVFGSEGGLTEQEVEKLQQAGFTACSLGPRILRAETAPIYFLSALSYEMEL